MISSASNSFPAKCPTEVYVDDLIGNSLRIINLQPRGRSVAT